MAQPFICLISFAFTYAVDTYRNLVEGGDVVAVERVVEPTSHHGLLT